VSTEDVSEFTAADCFWAAATVSARTPIRAYSRLSFAITGERELLRAQILAGVALDADGDFTIDDVLTPAPAVPANRRLSYPDDS